MKRRILACLLIVCVSIFSLSSCQQAFGKEGRLSDQDIYRFQREYGTAGGMQADGNMWMIVQDAVLLVKLVEGIRLRRELSPPDRNAAGTGCAAVDHLPYRYLPCCARRLCLPVRSGYYRYV